MFLKGMRRRGTVRGLGTGYDGGGTVDTVEGYGGYGPWRGAVDSVEGYGVGRWQGTVGTVPVPTIPTVPSTHHSAPTAHRSFRH
jgi:hypothetical protein